ncbi:hypothetical protein GWN91_01260 [Candidatus Saccharibacteria bacterium]|nr:hypothetical protein [Candidatus Saccharibacteria bacterium]NIW78321.1 hypothetical protein [Calditrichia bacterium]
MSQINKIGMILFVILALFLACATKTAIQVTKPAEIDATDLKRIALLDFRGPENVGSGIASIFISKLFKTKFYTLVERAELQQILSEHALNLSGAVDVETAVEAGQLLGVQGVIVGDVINYNCEDHRRTKKAKKKVWTGEYEKDENGNYVYEETLFGKKVKKKKYKEEWVDEEFIVREANVTLGFRLIEVETGKIRATREATHSHKQTLDADHSSGKDLAETLIKGLFGESDHDSPNTREEILTRLTQRCIDDFVRMLAPHKVTIHTEFAKGNDEVNKGIEFAKKDLWDKAQLIWEQVVSKDPHNHQAWYNLGLAMEAQAFYERAEKAYDRAATLKTEDLYLEALKRIRQEIEDNRKLREQLQELEEPEV